MCPETKPLNPKPPKPPKPLCKPLNPKPQTPERLNPKSPKPPPPLKEPRNRSQVLCDVTQQEVYEEELAICRLLGPKAGSRAKKMAKELHRGSAKKGQNHPVASEIFGSFASFGLGS